MRYESPYGRPQVASTSSVPAPIGGLNYRDSAAAMPATDAILMTNFQPLPYAVAVRKGWVEWATGMLQSVNTICNHARADGTQTIISAAGGSIYVQDAPGPAPVPVLNNKSSSWWQTTMMSNSAGTFTYMVNGVDKPEVFNGTAFTEVSQDDTDPQGFDVAGIDPTKFINVTLHQRRLWFVEKDSLSAWYLPSDLLGGEASEFPLGPVMGLGGHLVACISWTVDAGQGMDDYMAFISSRGQIALYAGTDPDQLGTWSLTGVFNIGAPVGYRCWCKFGGDVLLITRDGLVPLSKALQSTRINTQVALTDKIQHRISALVSDYAQYPGWNIFQFPNENQLWLTVPTELGVRTYSMNTITGAWCEYTNMEIQHLCLWNEFPLFGAADGRIGLAWQGYLDNVQLSTGLGEAIVAEIVTAYNYFNELGRQKRWVMCRPIFQSGQVPPSAIGVLTDFIYTGTPNLLDVGGPSTNSAKTAVKDSTMGKSPFGIQPFVPSTRAFSTGLAIWGQAIWGQSVWPSESTRHRNWVSIGALGYCSALSIAVEQTEALLWTATDFVFELGSVI